MAKKSDLADLPAGVSISPPARLADAYRDYDRFHVTVPGADGSPVVQERDVLRGGKVVAVLPVDLTRDEVVLIRQFRLPAHLANGRGDLVEIVAGRVEEGEQPIDAAWRECGEEIGVEPEKLVELFSYLPTPGIVDEEIVVYLGAVDATRVQPGAHVSPDGEQLHILCVSIDAALSALARGTIHGSPVLVALQWLALNRSRLPALLP